MFAAFYYWVGKISGYQYSELWGVIHFVVFTIAINIVFFPMVRPVRASCLTVLLEAAISVSTGFYLVDWPGVLASHEPNKTGSAVADTQRGDGGSQPSLGFSPMARLIA